MSGDPRDRSERGEEFTAWHGYAEAYAAAARQFNRKMKGTPSVGEALVRFGRDGLLVKRLDYGVVSQQTAGACRQIRHRGAWHADRDFRAQQPLAAVANYDHGTRLAGAVGGSAMQTADVANHYVA